MEWVDVPIRRGARERSAPCAPPAALGLLQVEQRELLAQWVRKDNASRGRGALLKEAGRDRIELAESLCDWLLREGWILRKESLVGGHWRWDSLTWRDLAALKQLLGVGSRSQRDEDRSRTLRELRLWHDELNPGNLAPHYAGLLDDLDAALSELEVEASPRVEILDARARWLKAMYAWCLTERQGTRRDFALHAGDHTKAIGASDWKWLEEHFDLEHLGISHFTPLIWVAGKASLLWGERRVDLAALSFVPLAIEDVLQVSSLTGSPANWWLIENRTSFERQALQLAEETVLIWLPGRPSSAWLAALEHLARLTPAPLKVSADADPAGVDMALTVGRLWRDMGQPWAPHLMGTAEISAAQQSWDLNGHDRALLTRLLGSPDLPQPLRELCEVMQQDGHKAEQEGWL